MHIDEQAERILFEGATQRYSIPAASILECEIHVAQTELLVVHAIVLRVQDATETFVLPFHLRWWGGLFNRKDYHKRIETVHETICRMMAQTHPAAGLKHRL